MNDLDYDEEVMLATYLEELPPLTRKQRWWLGAWSCGRFTHYGETRTRANLAAFRGVSRQRIEQVEERALRRLRIKFYCNKALESELAEIFKR